MSFLMVDRQKVEGPKVMLGLLLRVLSFVNLVINAGWFHRLKPQMRAIENNLFRNRCTKINAYKNTIDLQN